VAQRAIEQPGRPFASIGPDRLGARPRSGCRPTTKSSLHLRLYFPPAYCQATWIIGYNGVDPFAFWDAAKKLGTPPAAATGRSLSGAQVSRQSTSEQPYNATATPPGVCPPKLPPNLLCYFETPKKIIYTSPYLAATSVSRGRRDSNPQPPDRQSSRGRPAACRPSLDYILENVLDPSAVVAQDYQVTVLETKDGRVLTGIIRQENDKVVTLQTQNERVTVPKQEIQSRTKSPVSMMPEGMLDKLTNDEVRDLVAYLVGSEQLPLPKNVSNGH
jgi:putative heme-binding domain-containing protein